ncbi:hypothetical protein GCM10022403_033710 [Streptomyces coacervatus]|uniref:Uncharacterized protein n=1 Tax=Streptomyces coacervatus TaxID=647381 RepID=A0ABP7HN13_9ACTN|nr:hypothetical protein [Streptomyces coacervatus]MDF2272145.1 hypothetical protein [Streptomyces coacervatus]
MPFGISKRSAGVAPPVQGPEAGPPLTMQPLSEEERERLIEAVVVLGHEHDRDRWDNTELHLVLPALLAGHALISAAATPARAGVARLVEASHAAAAARARHDRAEHGGRLRAAEQARDEAARASRELAARHRLSSTDPLAGAADDAERVLAAAAAAAAAARAELDALSEAARKARERFEIVWWELAGLLGELSQHLDQRYADAIGPLLLARALGGHTGALPPDLIQPDINTDPPGGTVPGIPDPGRIFPIFGALRLPTLPTPALDTARAALNLYHPWKTELQVPASPEKSAPTGGAGRDGAAGGGDILDARRRNDTPLPAVSSGGSTNGHREEPA